MERKKGNATAYHKSSTPHLLHNPISFSSSLLDSIYRSIDEEHRADHKSLSSAGMVSYEDLTLTLAERKNRKAVCNSSRRNVEKWVMEIRRSRQKAAHTSSLAVLYNSNSNSSSSSTSSDSSFWSGGLSSSESEYSFRALKPTSISTTHKPEAIWPSDNNAKPNSSSQNKFKQQHHHSAEILAKTKSKALKIYAELKKAKVKQPISPGAKFASFINSLFVNTKRKPKTVSEHYGGSCDKVARAKHLKSKSTPSTKYDCPSSASSYSRSCLSKTPTSGGKPSANNGAKRSVRFDPVSIIVGEDSQPCGHKNLKEEDSLKLHITKEHKRNTDTTMKLFETYQRVKTATYLPENYDDELMDEDEDDGVSSCSSSDLFELDNLYAIGIERYREELPVYETTHAGTNRAIARGLLL